MGQTATRNDQKETQQFVSRAGGEEAVLESSKNGNRKKSTPEAAKAKAAIESAEAAQQRLKQSSNWSLGSLSGRLNWSFTGGAAKSSYRSRSSNSTRKSLTKTTATTRSLPKQQQRHHQCEQDQLRRSKTTWHKPLTNAIFNSHFKEQSRNEEFYIEDLIAKGAFGVVFKVIDKKQKLQQLQQQQQEEIPTSTSKLLSLSSSPPPPSPSTVKETATKTETANKNFKIYALKVLKKSKIIEQNSIQQLKDEADIQKICGHHPFIVQQFDLWQNRRNLHILSEFVPNGELFAKIANFSLELIRLYLAEIALALDFLHNAGIIYRDAKPENILLTVDYHIKLIDFGLSKWLKLGATTKTMCGTFQYMGTVQKIH